MALLNGSQTTPDATSGLVEAVRSSSILSERQLEKLEAIMAEADHPTEPAELADRLVKERMLTEYQAKQTLKGRSQGLTFGSYVILDFLGKGTMGKVYKASHRMMGRVVALKILEPRYITSTRSLARFQREMQLVGRLDHPNVIRAFDADRVGDAYFIAMEYMEGFTLDDWLKARGALPPADAVYYGSQVADGLAHAHKRGVLHRDIKPSNLLVTQSKKLKILDFGLGTLLEKDELTTALTTPGWPSERPTTSRRNRSGWSRSMAAATFTHSAVRCTTCSAGNSPSRGSRRWTVSSAESRASRFRSVRSCRDCPHDWSRRSRN